MTQLLWSGVVEVQFGTVVVADPSLPVDGGEPDPSGIAMAQAWEDRCSAIGGRLVIQVPGQNDDVAVEVRLVDEHGEIEAPWEHVVEAGLDAPSGHLQVFSWMAGEEPTGESDVPRGRLIARLHWAGLERWLGETTTATPRDDKENVVRLRVDLVPGQLDTVRTLRTWHLWQPPVHESTGGDGLRRYRGPAAIEHRARLEPLPVRFWSPYPTSEEGTITSLWRDPADRSRWADGSGPMSHHFLQELAPAEADALEAQGFAAVRTYAQDAQGRIWTSDQIPIERAQALLYLPPDRWAMLQTILPASEIRLIDLPAGWSRITRRPFDETGPAVVVEDGPASGPWDALYQRWRDGTEIPR